MNNVKSILSKNTYSNTLKPIAFNEVNLKDSFWLPRLITQKEKTLPFAFEKTIPAIENLRKCGRFLEGMKEDLPFPHRFLSSDLYKVMEGAAYLLMIDKDTNLENKMDEIISIIGKAQKDDGYLYVPHICGVAVKEEMGENPYEYVLHSHELYNVGHLYEGAVAYYLATGKKKWLDIAEKSAQHVNKVFFEGDANYNGGVPVNQAPGHQEIEIGLCKLYRVTGNELYLNMARRFLDIRGVTYTLDPNEKGVMAPEYAQQHKPVNIQEEAVGHAVRASYMYAGMADVGTLMEDDVYDVGLGNIWHNIINTKMHITGGLGAIHGIEGFGEKYDLPNKDAYNETCAAVGNILFNYRMFLRHKDAKYFDVAEIALFNNALAGVNIAGDRFFYVNPLEADGVTLFNHGNAGRAPWFDCACCPSNIARIMPQVGGYMYAISDSEIYCLLYGTHYTEIKLNDKLIKINQISNYPMDGKINISLSLESEIEFDFKIRIPTWTRNQFVPGDLYSFCNSSEREWTLKLNGEPIKAHVEKGFAVIPGMWRDGDMIELDLPMPVRYSKCILDVEANINRLAITRGPMVYCAEEIDNNDLVQKFIISKPVDQSQINVFVKNDIMDGMMNISLPAQKLVRNKIEDTTIHLIPYFAWNNRGNASMNVWFPNSKDLAEESVINSSYDSSKFGIVSASSCRDDATIEALSNGIRPQSSSDIEIPFWINKDRSSKSEEIELKFDTTKNFESLGVYWADNGIDIEVPKYWKVSYLKNNKWTDLKLYVTDFFGIEKDMYTVIHPSSELICDALRIEIKPMKDKFVGILDLDLRIKN